MVSLGVGRLREPGTMSAGGASDRPVCPFGLVLCAFGALPEAKAPRWGSECEPSELVLSLQVRVIFGSFAARGENDDPRPGPLTEGEAWDFGEAEAIDSSSSRERVCQPFCTFTIAYFSRVLSCCPIWKAVSLWSCVILGEHTSVTLLVFAADTELESRT